MYFIGKLKLDVSTQDNINAAFFKYLYLLYLLLHSTTFKNSDLTIIFNFSNAKLHSCQHLGRLGLSPE